ncbi:protein-lysine N-methyltransferase EEF2KMT-like isoform X2 [Sinocyclocheilus anshuiensis]|uniref:Protein-lysine N-methyltransferase EEF2KMT-like n=1 Tax=Sinocyclocheilus anshuiensis TaxID=1608454 RepID=A0A671NUU9_9TELE|nr:PREDICTED: protein-lysine N-methyltransferase EEF2KMT-like isoform X2 [Sinocyclocheilus anshuiensis]
MNYTHPMTDKEGEGMSHKTRKEVIHTFQVNFFATSLLNTFPWDSLDREIMTTTTSDIIMEILQKTCLHPICLKNPPSLKYRRRFLTELIKRHEMLAAEPLDVLYEALGEVMCAQEEDMCYKTYLLPTGDAVSLAENVALISQGTTGLVTWEAALYLSEWALENTHIFENKTVLELGSGIGLTGIVVCRSSSLTKYIFSDCHQTVLQRLKDNITNCLTNCDGNSASVCVEELDWENVSDEQLQRIQANTIIAADVVYDPDIIACLVRLLSRLLNCKVEEEHPDVYIASTVRNPQTYDCFKKELEMAGLRHVVMKDSVAQVFPYNRASTIEMIKIYV